jgi:hypothetical protein
MDTLNLKLWIKHCNQDASIKFVNYAYFVLNPFNPIGNYMHHLLTISSTAFFIYGFCMILSVNNDYFLKQR